MSVCFEAKVGEQLKVGKVYRDNWCRTYYYVPINSIMLYKYKAHTKGTYSTIYEYIDSTIALQSNLKKDLVLVEDPELRLCWHKRNSVSGNVELTIGNPSEDIDGYAYSLSELLDMCLSDLSWEKMIIDSVGHLQRRNDIYWFTGRKSDKCVMLGANLTIRA